MIWFLLSIFILIGGLLIGIGYTAMDFISPLTSINIGGLIILASIWIGYRHWQSKKHVQEDDTDMADSLARIFRELYLNELKLQGKRWAERYPEALIEKVILYRYSSKHQKPLSGIVPAKYFVMFEVPENSDSGRLETDTEYNQTIFEGYLAFIGSDFTRVYQDSVTGDDFKNDWVFFVKKPSKELPIGVMVNEPFWVLYP